MKQHFFDVDIACEYGMLEAVLLNHLMFWIEHNEANGTNFHDGRYWTFNSTAAFGKIFPYVSTRKIRNALKRLEEEGIIVTGNYNKSTYDRTLWYGFTEKGYSIMQKCQMEREKMSNGNTEKVKPIPDNITNKKPDKETNKEEAVYFPLDAKLNSAFSEFVKFRKEIKSPMTDHAIELAIKKLEKLGGNDNDKKVRIIEQSIMNGWKGLFDVKDQNVQSSNPWRDMIQQNQTEDYDPFDLGGA